MIYRLFPETGKKAFSEYQLAVSLQKIKNLILSAYYGTF